MWHNISSGNVSIEVAISLQHMKLTSGSESYLNKCLFFVFFFYFVLFLAKYIQNFSSISMLVMSLVLTISAWLVNFTYFAYLLSLHILTFASFVKKYRKFNYICYLHIKSYIDKFYIDYLIVVIKVAKFSL